jgi:hypothetical protein
MAGGPDGSSPEIKKPDPAARPETQQEADLASRKVRRRARAATGRESQILAGRLTRSQNDVQFKQVLG